MVDRLLVHAILVGVTCGSYMHQITCRMQQGRTRVYQTGTKIAFMQAWVNTCSLPFEIW